MKMKQVLLAGAAAIAFGAPAIAADLPVATRAPAPAYVPAYNWTGFYLGANLGGGWARETDTGTAVVPGFGTFVGTATTNLNGVIGGGQIGYNWQAGNLVFGVEADIDGSGETSTNAYVCPAASCGVALTATASDKVQAFGTARGRVGFAADRWLFYVTGGYSWQNINNSYTGTAAGVGTALYSTSTTRGGYALGGGVETALWGNWTGRVEYLYLDTGTFGTGGPFTVAAGSALALNGVPVGSTLTTTGRVQNNIVRVGLNYRF